MEGKIHQRIRDYRKLKGLTLKELAERAGCTQSYISQLEKRTTMPSLSMVGKLARALDVNVVDLFADPPEESQKDWHLPKEERRIIEYPGGKVLSQMLVSRITTKKMEPLISVVEPGGGSDRVEPGERSGHPEKISHPRGTEEFVLVLKGGIDFQINGKTLILREGDTLYFDGNRPHCWVNNGTEAAEVLFVFSPPTW
ncbi:MAG: helix-turn-helix domain-containing protein [Deltaproteobacteria bacterium]|nr:helix-turn-helix domain-containing protein [Deltaproteobacteria bacterium]